MITITTDKGESFDIDERDPHASQFRRAPLSIAAEAMAHIEMNGLSENFTFVLGEETHSFNSESVYIEMAMEILAG